MKLSVRMTPYFVWLVEARHGRKRKILERFGSEADAKAFLKAKGSKCTSR